MKKLIKVSTALLFNAIMGALIALLLGYNPFWGAATASLVAIAAGTFMPKGSAYDEPSCHNSRRTIRRR